MIVVYHGDVCVIVVCAVSQTLEELSDITIGLNELLQSSTQARAEENEVETKSESATADVAVLDETSSPSVVTNLFSPPEGSCTLIVAFTVYTCTLILPHAATHEELGVPDVQLKVNFVA